MIDTCYVGDVRDGLRAFIAAGHRARCCVTSPPYYGLRTYNADGQIGLEPTFEEYVATMVEVFRLVRDALTDDGTCWLNLGDSYMANPKGSNGFGRGGLTNGGNWQADANPNGANRQPQRALKPKDLMLMPERVALALQADGWWIRSRIIWYKLAPMPESVRDRPTKSHEHIWLLSRGGTYFYDAEVARESVTQDERRASFRGGAYINNGTFDNGDGGESTDVGNVRVKVPSGWDTKPGAHGTIHRDGRTLLPEYNEVGAAPGNERRRKGCPNGAVSRSGNKERKSAAARGVPGADPAYTDGAVAGSVPWEGSMRNWRDVWPIGPEPFNDAHFATFPSEIPRRAIVAGSAPGDIVLDPFMGSGTTAMVAQSLGRRWFGTEINPTYVEMQARRAAQLGMEFVA